MLIVALVLAVIGLAALVTAVVTSNELIAWACIAASVVGVLLLIVDALRERSRGDAEETPAEESHAEADDSEQEDAEDYPEEAPTAQDDVAESDAETTMAEQPDEVADEDSNSR
jgi:flagellar biosynthesis/type III secretory pathway M-ring protein FliF/YscJ